ncbi:uncharacterized protein N7479_009665 [Penicillium vulpinum]|uniref:uncharacterized protein n=1 Tax=Penicillium vulpinum TaxID=29845 RepID=UPI002548F5D3|nr:uncharacterized protein N7479_009665 [Penicillium vulpinum]KAJ5951252.1 hypothetical protein N7479_009665 [Penicillium vulpinum]
MASDQRFERTLLAVAEAVQTFAAGTFEFAESIKRIWGPQTEPDAVETSNPLHVEGMQDVQVVCQVRERTPVSQDGDQLAVHSHTHPPSVTMHGEDLQALQESSASIDTANMQISIDIDALAGSTTQQAFRCCYKCFSRWQDGSANPPCQPIPGREIPAGELGMMLFDKIESDRYLIEQTRNATREGQNFGDSFHERPEIPLCPPIAGIPQPQLGSKRAHQDNDEQQPVFKRQRTQKFCEKARLERNEQLKKAMQQEQDDHEAIEDSESSSSSVSSPSSIYSSSSSEEEEAQVNSEAIKVSDVVRALDKIAHNEVMHEEENDRSSTLTQEQSSGESSSEEYDSSDDYSSSQEEEAVQILAAKEVSQEERNVKAKAAIQPEDENSEASSSSAEDDSSEEDLEEEPEYQLKNQLALKAGAQAECKEMIKEAIPILLEEENTESESSSSSSEDESSEEESDESDEEPEKPQNQPATEKEPPQGRKVNSQELVQLSSDESSNSSSETSSSEESEDEPEESKKQRAAIVEAQKKREEKPQEPIEILSDEPSEEDSEMET